MILKQRWLDYILYRGDPVVGASWDMVHNIPSTVFWMEAILLNIYNRRSTILIVLVCCCHHNKLS